MLTQQQIDDFHRDGFLIMRGVFQGRELSQLTEAANEVQRQGVAREGSDHRYANFNEQEIVYWRSEKMWKRGDIFLAVTVNPVLLENIGQIIGDYFMPYNESLVVKLPYKGAPVNWHQDPPYGDPQRVETFGRPNFTADIYLDHSGPDNGCVYAIPGHHLVGNIDLKSAGEEELFEKYGAVPIEMEPGDVLFHCVSTPHGSRANTSDKQRRIFYIHYLSEAVRSDTYPNWLKDKTETAHLDFCSKMIEARNRLNLENAAERHAVRYDKNGFLFTGTPISPVDEWQRRIEAMTPEQFNAKKHLLA